ncbi:DUF167 domain-containing protein [Massilia sp. TWR1-2-2]|uniref:DUF167 domain-containing protein n=1 Tax=Massilia sp. TWR1-2-2 TaxID=2804584 RepID=UPI003CE9BC10
MSRGWCSALPAGIRLAVQITPNAKKTEMIGVLDGALKLKLQAQPIEGKANEALVKYLAAALSVPRSAVTITHGLANKRKLIEVNCAGLTVAEVERLLVGALG